MLDSPSKDDVKVIWDDPEEMGAGTFGYYHTTLLAVHSYLKVTGAGGDEEGTEEAMELNGTYVPRPEIRPTFYLCKSLTRIMKCFHVRHQHVRVSVAH